MNLLNRSCYFDADCDGVQRTRPQDNGCHEVSGSDIQRRIIQGGVIKNKKALCDRKMLSIGFIVTMDERKLSIGDGGCVCKATNG